MLETEKTVLILSPTLPLHPQADSLQNQYRDKNIDAPFEAHKLCEPLARGEI